MVNNSKYNKLEPILFEMEINHVERGNLYVSLECDILGKNVLSDDWPHPSDSGPGEWRTIENLKIDLLKSSGVFQLLNLYTLSGLLFFKRIKDRLYKAEFEGEPIEILSNVYPTEGDESVRYLKGIKKGVSVARARLVKEIDSWNNYSAFTFACDCAERAILNDEKVFGHPNETNNSGIVFARALGKYHYLDDPADIEAILGKKFTNKKERFEYISSSKKLLLSKLSELASLNYASKALVECFDHIYRPSRAVQKAALNARINRATIGFLELKSIGLEVPDWFRIKENEKETVNRIWYLYQKKELEWQALHLEKILFNKAVESSK
jgi:hypothetical protein